MASMIGFDSVLGFPTQDSTATSRTVPDLQAALGIVRRRGGSIRSEVRTAPGIGSWAFVADPDGIEHVLWENAARIGH